MLDGDGWDFACPDWEARLRDGRSLVPDLPLDEVEAARAIAIFNRLRLPDVPGQPAMAEAAGDWFRDIVGSVFGSIDARGRRRVRETYGLVPKKNNKTTGGAAVMLTALLMNERPRAEFLLVGPTQDIADLAFQQVSGMIEADPDGYLGKRFKVQEHLKTIRDLLNGAFLRIKTFDMKVMTGSKPVGILIDELHVMSLLSYASRVMGQMRGGLLANPEGFLIVITTQSDQPPAGVFKAELQYARAVRDGRIKDSRLLPILYEFPEAMQTAPDAPWRDPKNWSMVNPNLGLSIDLETLIADYRDARDKGAEEERRWASQHLNVEIGLALHSERWRGADYWLGAAEAGLTLEALLERSEVVTIGIDGGGMDDMLGLVVIGRCAVTRAWLVWGHAWIQPGVLELRKEIAEQLRDLEAAGDLTICEAVTQDVMEIAELVERIEAAGLLPEKAGIGIDPVGIAALTDELEARDLGGERIAAVSQGFRLSGAIWGAERKLADGTLRHAGQALMAWCVGNARAVQRGNAVLIEKAVAGKAKIDPLIALFNAFALMGRAPEAFGASVYSERGLLTV
ncbi:terminase TerL endonuclease subunit [Amaricoccus sp.]|uniref:terminase large subunit n=1 Tax=Amaricoccus sp. TaxID=1872485 RepID=UPI00261E624C|nr:terminase TerL endonuclease subunit [uncultured Amaricoccus sp.]